MVLAVLQYVDDIRDRMHLDAYTNPQANQGGNDGWGYPYTQADLTRLKLLQTTRRILRNSEAAANLVKHFNAHLKTIPQQQRTQPSSQTFDFSQMYTNLPQADIIAAHLSETHAMQAYLTNLGAPDHLQITFNQGEAEYQVKMTRKPTKSDERHLIITLQQFHDQFFSFLIRHCHVQYDGILYQQIGGIGMGISAAVVIANNICAHYEYVFITNLIRFRLWHMLSNMQSYGRYIDDILALDCPWLFALRYKENSMVFPPHLPSGRRSQITLSGIFPHGANGDILTLNLEQDDSVSPHPLTPQNDPNHPPGLSFLDLLISWCPTTRQYIHQTFDKRALDKFKWTPLTKFPKPSSCLWQSCYTGLIPSELNRYRSTCSDLKRWIIPTANLLLELYLKNYNWTALWDGVTKYLHSKGSQYNNDQERQYSAPQLEWMTRQALVARVTHLWDTGHQEYQHRNHVLNIAPDIPSPTAPPPIYTPKYTYSNPHPNHPNYHPNFPHNLQNPFYWAAKLPKSIK